MRPLDKSSDARVPPLLKEGQELANLGRFEDALSTFDRALALDPNCAWAWAHRGDLLCQHLGRYGEAVESFDRAIALDPGYAWAWAHRGAAHERLDAFDEAERDFQRALALNPSNTWALAMQMRIFQRTNRYAEALEALEGVIERDGSVLPPWRAERGLLRTLLGRYEEAERYYLLALDADSTDQLALYNLAINTAHWRGAAAALPRIQALRDKLLPLAASSDARAIYELGGLAALEGKDNEALDYLQQAIALESGLVLLSPARKRAQIDLAWRDLRSHERFRTLTQT